MLGGILLLGGILRYILGSGEEEEETRPTNSTNRTVPTTAAATAGNHAVPTSTTASNRDYSPYNDTSSSRRHAPTTTTTAATASNRAVPTTTTTTAATASKRAVPTTTTVSNRDYSPYNDTSSRSHVPTTTAAAATASYRNYSPYYDTSSTANYVPTTTTTTTTATTYPPLTRQASDANMGTQNRTPNYSNSQNSTPTKLPDRLNFSFASSSKTVPSVSTPPSSPASSSSTSSGIPLSSPKPLRPSSKPFLSPAPSNPTDPNSKTDYILVEKSTSPIYAIPEDIRDSIKKNVVPGILKRPLSPSTYKDYFEALLYAEDFYLEKWDGFEMKNVTLELHEAAIYKRKGKCDKNVDDEKKDDKVFVTFELDSIPERRPFLLSRDFVSVQPSGTNAEPFQGLIYRVVKSNRVLVDFGEDFLDQHFSACKYNVKFSFNRVCLKRAHQAIATASGPLFRNFLFPDLISKNSLTAQLQSIKSNLDSDQVSGAVRKILSHQNAIPYLVEGPIQTDRSSLSRTGFVVCEAVLQVYRTSPSCRILICAPTNNACDAITRNLKKKIPESDIFRANAAFREFDGVPEDILPSCHYKEERECFACPSLEELRKFKVISSTFMSSFRLHNEGIMAGHFRHIFLVDASSVIEPEAMVPLANLANESTAVTITGTPGNHSGWIRSHIARQNGLLTSYFERLRESKLYESLDPKLITQL